MSILNFIFGKEKITFEEVIKADIKQLEIHKFAIEKAVAMIAKAIVKSNIKFLDKNGEVSDANSSISYRVNVQPNENELKVEFWTRAIKRMLLEQECLIYRDAKDRLYRVESYDVDQKVMAERTYSNIVIKAGGNTMRLNKKVKESDMLTLRYPNEKISAYVKSVLAKYDKTISAMLQMKNLSNAPKFKNIINAQMSIREKREDGTEHVLTQDEYKARIREFIENDGISIFTKSQGLELEQFKIETATTYDEIEKLQKNIFNTAAMAFDIPELLYFGTITEKSDATNEFITMAVDPVAKVIETAMDAKFIGYDDYIAGEHTKIDMRNFKHRDVVEAASGLDKLRGDGFTLDELREMVGYEPLNTEFSTARALTKNYQDENENL